MSIESLYRRINKTETYKQTHSAAADVTDLLQLLRKVYSDDLDKKINDLICTVRPGVNH